MSNNDIYYIAHSQNGEVHVELDTILDNVSEPELLASEARYLNSASLLTAVKISKLKDGGFSTTVFTVKTKVCPNVICIGQLINEVDALCITLSDPEELELLSKDYILLMIPEESRLTSVVSHVLKEFKGEFGDPELSPNYVDLLEGRTEPTYTVDVCVD